MKCTGAERSFSGPDLRDKKRSWAPFFITFYSPLSALQQRPGLCQDIVFCKAKVVEEHTGRC